MSRFVREPERAYGADVATARRLKDIVLQTTGPNVRGVILFGSQARGDAGPDSDFDLLVVADGLTPSERQSYRLALYRAFEDVGVVVEPWVMSEETYEEEKTVIGGLAHLAW